MTIPMNPVPSGQTFAQREPALTYGGGLTAASLIVDAIIGLGIPLTDTAKIMIILVVSVVGPFAGTLLTRQKVFSPATVAAMGQDAKTALTVLGGGLSHPDVVQPPPDSPGKHAAP